MRPSMSILHRSVLVVSLALGALSLDPSQAAAQEVAPAAGNRVEATPKGTIGLGLIGAEIGLAVPALAGLHETWSLITFPAIGAAGGAVGGYFAIDEPGHETASVAVLAVGAALLLPSVALTVMAVKKNPDFEDLKEPPARDGKAKGEVSASGKAEARTQKSQADATHRARRLAAAGGGLLRKGDSAWALSLPAVRIEPTFTPKELHIYGVEQTVVYNLPVATGVF